MEGAKCLCEPVLHPPPRIAGMWQGGESLEILCSILGSPKREGVCYPGVLLHLSSSLCPPWPDLLQLIIQARATARQQLL